MLTHLPSLSLCIHKASQYLYFVTHTVCLPWHLRASCQKLVLKGCSFDNKARNVTIYMTATNLTARNSFEGFRPPSQLQVVFSRFCTAAAQTWGTHLLQPSDHCHWVYCWYAFNSHGYNAYILVYSIKVHTNDITWTLGGCRRRVA